MPANKRRFVVSVDTEEDIWGWSSTAPVTCANVLQLPRLARFFERLHIRPTFFVTHQVLSDPSARAVIEELVSEDWIEIGCHVHPWNTPPFDSFPRRTILYNYPLDVQASKIGATTQLFEEVLGRRPASFRAGRFGFGSATAECLIEQGYRVDSSVTPFFDWTGSSGGQNYVGAPLEIYRIDPESGVLKDDPGGRLIEVPLTSGYTRFSPDSWTGAARFLHQRPIRELHLGGLGAWVLGFRRTILSPEAHTVGDMVALASRVARSGVEHLHMFFHSSSLLPGLTPFTRTSGDVERLYERLEEALGRMHGDWELDFASVTEVAEASPDPALRSIRRRSPLRVMSPEGAAGRAPAAAEEELELSEPRGIKARLKFWARYLYWKLGGYRRFQRVRWASVKRLVFVCTGNICRSPYAEHVARGRTPIDAVSLGVSTTLDGVADPTALKVAGERGVRMDEHRTTPLGNFEPREGDLFIAMEPFQAALVVKQRWVVPHQVTLLGLWAGSNGPVIPDPYGGDDRRFAQCFSVIERGIETIRMRIEQTSGRRSGRVAPSGDAS